MKEFKKLKLASMIAIALGISACGGGGGDDTTTGDTTDTTNLAGTVADGYLVGATVCLDTNENGACDPGEPTTTTGAGGSYTLGGVSAADAAAYPIVVEISADTVDEDTGTAVGSAYVMSAPADSGGFVSPLTTMVHSALQSNPSLSLDDAEDSVIEALGFDPDTSAVSLFEDYIAATDTGSTNANADDYELIHDVARVTAAVIANNYAAVTAATDSADVDIDLLVQLIVNQVIEQLGSIVAAVETATADGGTFDETDVTSISGTVSDIDTTTLAQQIAAIELITETVSETDLIAWIEEGFSWAWGEMDDDWSEYEYGTLSKGTGNTLVEAYYTYDGSIWVLGTEDNADDENIELTATGWQNIPKSSNLTYALQSDGSLALSDTGTGTAFGSVTGVLTVDVAGDNISNFLTSTGDGNDGLSGFGVDSTAVFSTGAEAFSFSFDEPYHWGIGYWDCDGDNYGQVYTAGTGTNCSVAWDQGTPLQQLDSVIGVTHDIGDNLEVSIAGSASNASGSATFTLWDYSGNTPQSTDTLGTWSRTTMNTEDMVIIDIPPAVRPYSWDGDDVSKVFFSVFDGYVRVGWYEAGGIEAEWMLNAVAMQDLRDNFSPGTANTYTNEETGGSGTTTASLTACTDHDSGWDETNGVPLTFASYAEYQTAVDDCMQTTGGPITADMINDATYVEVGDEGVQTTFSSGGALTLVNGTETFQGSWSIDSDGYIVIEIGSTERETMAIVEMIGAGDQVSLVQYYESSDWSDMNKTVGTDGEILSSTMIRQ